MLVDKPSAASSTVIAASAMRILGPSPRGALLACSLRRGLDRVRRQLVEGLDDRRQTFVPILQPPCDHELLWTIRLQCLHCVADVY